MRRFALVFVLGIGLPFSIIAIASCSSADSGVAASHDSTTGPRQVTYAQIAEGSFLYHQNDCRKCHYSSAVGGHPEHGGPSLIDDEWLHCDGSIEGIQRVVLEGVPLDQLRNAARDSSMPGASEMGLSREQARLIATYIWVLGQREPD